MSHVAVQTLIFLNAPKLFFVTFLMLLYVLIKGSQGQRNLYDVFQTMILTSITSLYTVYVGRYANPTQSIPHSDEFKNILNVIVENLNDYTQINSKELMEMLITAFLK